MAEEEKPAAPVGPDGEMRSELQELQLQMNTTTDEVSLISIEPFCKEKRFLHLKRCGYVS